MEAVVLEEGVVGLKEDVSTRLILRRFRAVLLLGAPFEEEAAHFALAKGLHLKARAEGIDRLDTHAIKADALLESLGIVFATGIQHAHGFYELSLWDAAPIVAHGYAEVVLNVNLYSVTGIHLELINRIINHLLQQHVDAVLRQ